MGVEYKIRINDPPQSEALTSNCVRLTVLRVLTDGDGMTVKAEKVRDPETIKAWSQARAELKAIERGNAIVWADQDRRGVKRTEKIHFRGR